MELNLSRSMTLNTGNYQSIRPSVSITVNTDSDRLLQDHTQLSDLVEKLFQLETAVLYSEQKHINKEGLVKYTNDTFKNIDNLMDEIEEIKKGLK